MMKESLGTAEPDDLADAEQVRDSDRRRGGVHLGDGRRIDVLAGLEPGAGYTAHPVGRFLLTFLAIPEPHSLFDDARPWRSLRFTRSADVVDGSDEIDSIDAVPEPVAHCLPNSGVHSMNRSLRVTTTRFLGSLVFGATFLAAGVAIAAPGPETESATLESKLGAVLGRPGGLTAATVAARAEATSFDVQARREDLEAAAASVDQALVGYFPKLSLLGRYTRLSPITQPSFMGITFPVLLNQTLLQATLNVPLSDYLLRIPQTYAAATKSQRAAQVTEQATRLKAASDAKILYYTWVRAKLQEVVAEQALLQAKAHLTDAQHAFDAGTASKADVLRIESQMAQSRLLLEKSKSYAEIAETQIRVTTHDAGQTQYEVGEAIDADATKVQGSDNLAGLFTEASATRLEIKALEQNSDSLREQAKIAKAGYIPRLDAFGDVIYANPNQRIFPIQDSFKATWDVGVQLTFSPNDLATAGPQARALTARASGLVAQKQALEDGIRIEVTQSRNALREAHVALETTAQGLTAAEEAYRVRRSLFKNGRSTGLELTDAETELTRARLEAINARVDIRIATVRLEHALGRDVAQRPANGGSTSTSTAQ